MPKGNTRVIITGQKEAAAKFSIAMNTREEAQRIADEYLRELERSGGELDSLLRQLALDADAAWL